MVRQAQEPRARGTGSLVRESPRYETVHTCGQGWIHRMYDARVPLGYPQHGNDCLVRCCNCILNIKAVKSSKLERY